MTPARGPQVRIGELCFGGDWACAHGDLSGLADIAQQLAARAREPLHCDLAEVVEACRVDPVRATELWFAIRDRVLSGAIAW